MKLYLAQATIGLSIGLLFCTLADGRADTDWSSWSWFGRIFGILAWGYVAFAPSMLVDLFQSKRCWASDRARSMAIPTMGAFWGFICLNYAAHFYSRGELMSYGGSPLQFSSPTIAGLAEPLFSQLGLLSHLKYFVDHAVQASAGTALFAMIGFWLYDKHKPGWATATFSTFMLLPIPVLVLMFPDCRMDFAIFLLFYLMPWSMFSLLMIGIVWVFRTGLLTCDITELPVRWKQWRSSN